MTELSMSLRKSLSLLNLWNSLVKRYHRFRIYRETVRDLNMLSDRELNDLGIHRSTIRSIAMEAYYDDQVR